MSGRIAMRNCEGFHEEATHLAARRSAIDRAPVAGGESTLVGSNFLTASFNGSGLLFLLFCNK
jgi:hypothetical protein